jgi:plasmid stability protein
MPAFLIRNIPKKTHQAIKKRAKRHGNSTEAELRLIVEEVARQESAPPPALRSEVGFGTALQQIFQKHGVSLPDIPRDRSPGQPAIFE